MEKWLHQQFKNGRGHGYRPMPTRPMPMKLRLFTLYIILQLFTSAAWATPGTAEFYRTNNESALEKGTAVDPTPATSVRTNPFTTELTVDNALLVTRYSVMNMLGQQLLSGDNNDSATLTIDSTRLPKGIYLLVLQTLNGKKITIRVVKSE